MEIKPHPEKNDQAIVTVHDKGEELSVEHRLPTLSRHGLKAAANRFITSLSLSKLLADRDGRLHEYPRELALTHRELGYVAFRAMHPNSIEQDVGLARQIVEYFGEQYFENRPLRAAIKLMLA